MRNQREKSQGRESALILLLTGIFVILIMELFLVSAIPDSVIYVDSRAKGMNDGTSWENAYSNLQNALSLASEGDEVWVAEGTYKPGVSGFSNDGVGSVTDSFDIPSEVSLYGGFSGGEMSLDERSLGSLSVLSGDLNGDDESDFTNREDNSFHVVRTLGSVVIDGFEIRGGYASGGGIDGSGGGVLCSDSSLTLVNSLLEDNWAVSGGGAIYLGESCSTKIFNSEFKDNFAVSSGGAIGNKGAFNIRNSYFFENGASVGGAISSDSIKDKKIINSKFYSNTADAHAGAIFSRNRQSSKTHIQDSVFMENQAPVKAGGVFLSSGENMMVNLLFVKNSALKGSGFWSGSGNTELQYSTFAGNELGPVVMGHLENTLIRTTIIQENVNESGIYPTTGGPLSVEYSNVQTPDGSVWAGKGNINEYPEFVSTDEEDYHLLSSSSSVDAGNNDFVTVSHDLDGNDRIVNGIADIGAFEFQDVIEECYDLTGDDVVNFSDVMIVLDSWGDLEGQADLNKDGVVNQEDLDLVLGNWGSC